jgi:pyruvate,orthophosphate dikinase
MGFKYIYFFGDGSAEGNSEMKSLLGGKGANLAEMNLIGLPVPPGITITTEVNHLFLQKGKTYIRNLLRDQMKRGIQKIEQVTGTIFGDEKNPCLVSVRSGSPVSMPGMMDTILNLGLNDKTVHGLAKKTENEWFAWDSYRRFVQMYGDVVFEIKNFTDGDDPFEKEIIELKAKKKIESRTDFTVEDLTFLVQKFKKIIFEFTKNEFPEDPHEQLWNAVFAVFSSWMNERAILYREMENIPNDLGTAVNIQSMVFGNMGENSATGVAFTRDASTGEPWFNGEYLINAQGEDVVAGIRTPQQISTFGSKQWAEFMGISEKDRKKKFPSLEEKMPGVYAELLEAQKILECHYKDMQDIEFTIQNGKLWILQTRAGKRTGQAMVKIAMDLLEENLISETDAIFRIEPIKLNELLHRIFDPKSLKQARVVAKGLPASPGASAGRIVFNADTAEEWKEKDENVILVRNETSPEDLRGMKAARGILTARGGMTSHAAVVARGMGKCCVSGAESLKISYKDKTMKTNGDTFKEGDWISLNGSTGEIFEGKIESVQPQLTDEFHKLMKLADKYADLKVRTNADTPVDSQTAREFGAVGIGLCRTEHMFFESERILAMRQMILASDEPGRRKALDKLIPFQRSDFEGIFEAMHDLPVTVRLLDPPLHEFIPHDKKSQKEIAEDLGIPLEEIQQKVLSLEESNPMLGHRGCRLANTYPEITEMQTRAIIEAALNLKERKITAKPEIMIPLVGSVEEFEMQEKIVREIAEQVFEERGMKIEYFVGTMIEIPRAALTADKIAKKAEFFSFGTNDLTQMTFGYSRDDTAKFLPGYIESGILKENPFKTLDKEGVGQLVEMGTIKGRSARNDLKVGICGEHGGDPASINFVTNIGLDYVSCSPFRVPIARISAAQSNLRR